MRTILRVQANHGNPRLYNPQHTAGEASEDCHEAEYEINRLVLVVPVSGDLSNGL